jgi:hypothetical protein
VGWSSQVVIASQVIIEGTDDGLFVYSGTAGPGTLVGSWVPPGVTEDQYGNAVTPDGIGIYGTGGQEIFLGLLGAVAELQFRTGAAIEGTPANMAGGAAGAGATETLQLLLSGPRLNVAGAQDWAQVQITSNNPGGTSNAQVFINWISTAGSAAEVAAFGETGMALFNAVSIPLAFSNLAGVFAAGGVLKFMSGADGNVYDVARLTQMLQGTYTTTGTAPAVPTAGIVSLDCLVAAAAYRFKAHLIFTGGQNAGAMLVAMASTAGVTFGRVEFTCQLIAGGAITWTGGVGFTLTAGFDSQTLNTANPQVMDVEGQAVFSTAGQLSVTVAETVNGDTAAIAAGSYLELYPI